tara:strand:+ start:47 stop:664 length:618 start_codon:yes stop_codon:yes gene_type:complete
MKKLTDKELVVLVKEGNQKATTILFNKLRPSMIYSLSKKSVGQFSKVEIEDIVQESFIKAYTQIEKYKPSYSFSSWINRICKNTLIDHSRKYSKKVINLSLNVDSDDENESVSIGKKLFDESLNPQEEFERKQMKELAHTILSNDRIPERLRVVATLRYIEEKSYEEILDVLNIPLGSIKSNLNRFRKIASEQIKYRKAYDNCNS